MTRDDADRLRTPADDWHYDLDSAARDAGDPPPPTRARDLLPDPEEGEPDA